MANNKYLCFIKLMGLSHQKKHFLCMCGIQDFPFRCADGNTNHIFVR